jgi:hypothetical protein
VTGFSVQSVGRVTWHISFKSPDTIRARRNENRAAALNCNGTQADFWPADFRMARDPGAIRKQALRRDRDPPSLPWGEIDCLSISAFSLRDHGRAGMGRMLTIGTPVVLDWRLLRDGASRNWGLAPDAANPSFSWFCNDLNV